MESSVFQAKEISKRYGNSFALTNISFTLTAGQVTGLIGPNGSGKTTLLEIGAGLLPADSGIVQVSGRNVPPTERRNHLFYLPDHLIPYPDCAAMKVRNFFCDVFSIDFQTRERITELTGIGPVLGKRVGQLSKGFKKRLGLAISLWSPQPILLLDEPFDGFDLRQTLSIMEVLKDTAKAGRTLLLSIHQLMDAERVCDRLVLLNQGRLVAQGNLDDLRNQAKTPGSGLEEVFLALT